MGSRVVWVKQHLGTENFIRLTVKSLRKAFYNFREFAISIITNTLIATPMVASKVVRIVSWQVSRQRVANFATRPRPRWAQARHQSDRWRIGACLRHAGTSAAQAPPRYSRRYHSSIQRSWGGGARNASNRTESPLAEDVVLTRSTHFKSVHPRSTAGRFCSRISFAERRSRQR